MIFKKSPFQMSDYIKNNRLLYFVKTIMEYFNKNNNQNYIKLPI